MHVGKFSNYMCLLLFKSISLGILKTEVYHFSTFNWGIFNPVACLIKVS